MKHIKSIIILAGLMTLIVVAWGSNVSIPYTFSSGQTISSGQMNQNFSAVQTAVNSKQDQLNTTCASGQFVQSITGGNPTCAAVSASGGAVISVANACDDSADPCVTTTGGSTSTVLVQSILITVPGPGTLRVSFNGTAECYTTSSRPDVLLLAQIVSASGTTPSLYGDGMGFAESTAPTLDYRSYPLHMSRLFSVPGSGPYSTYVTARNLSTTTGPCKIYGGNMDALWISG